MSRHVGLTIEVPHIDFHADGSEQSSWSPHHISLIFYNRVRAIAVLITTVSETTCPVIGSGALSSGRGDTGWGCFDDVPRAVQLVGKYERKT